MNIEDIVKKMTQNSLSYKEQSILSKYLNKEKKIVFWDPEITGIFNKLNTLYSILQINENKIAEVESYVKKMIRDCDDEIEWLDDRISEIESEKRELEYFIKKL